MKTILIFSFLMFGNLIQAQPIQLGHSDTLYSQILGENRALNIYLPPEYNSDDTTTYQVVFLLDGSIDEDFIHVSGLFQFLTMPWVNREEPAIVVGIGTVDRRRDYTFPTRIEDDRKQLPTSGGSALFMGFIEKELVPYIKKTYRHNGQTTLIGQSLGGLFASEVLLTRPHLFNRYVIVSPSLWWDNGSLLKREPVQISKAQEVYIGVGKEGLAPLASARVMEVDAFLLADKLRKSKGLNVQVYMDYLPEEDHATILHQALMNAFRQF